MEVEYHHLIPVCLLGLTVVEKMQRQNNTDNQIMINVCPPLLLLCPHTEGGKNLTGGAKKLRAPQLEIFCPPHLTKTYSPPLQVLQSTLSVSINTYIQYGLIDKFFK